MGVRVALFLVILASFAASVQALDFDVEVGGVIDGNLAWMEIEPGIVQEASVSWENTGSTGCEVRARMDYFDENSSLVYTGWSEAVPLWAGSQAGLSILSALPGGNYTARLRVYFCNEIFEYGPFVIESVQDVTVEGVFMVTNVETHEEYIDVHVNSMREAGDVVVIPSTYPMGWIMGSGRIESIVPGLGGVARLHYEPSIWKESVVELTIASEEGFVERKRVFLSREQSFQLYWLAPVLAAMLIIILLIYLRQRKIKLNIWQSVRRGAAQG